MDKYLSIITNFGCHYTYITQGDYNLYYCEGKVSARYEDFKQHDIFYSNCDFNELREEMEWIEKLFDLPNSDKNIKYMNATEIIEFIKEKENINKIISADTIGKLMSSKGFRKKTRDNLKKYELILK